MAIAMAGVAGSCGDSRDAVTTSDESTTTSAQGIPFEALYAYDATAVSDVRALADQVAARLELLGAGSVSVAADREGQLRIRITPAPGVDPAATVGAATETGVLRFRPVLSTIPAGVDAAITSPAEDHADQVVHLSSTEAAVDAMAAAAVYELGPTLATGSVIASAIAEEGPTGAWNVALTLRPGGQGLDAFNEAAAACFDRTPICPSGSLAIVLDSFVQSAPTIQQRTFEADQIQISGDFEQEDAEGLAAVLLTGALPTALEPVAP